MIHAVSSAITARQFRQTLVCFATGVTVLTTELGDGQVHAMTANAFSSLSLDPPLVMVAVSCQSRMQRFLTHRGHFGVSILALEHKALADHFAGKRQQEAQTMAFAWEHGYPLIPGAIASLLCTVKNTHVEGDHTLFIGRVEHLWQTPHPGEPLLFYRGSYAMVREEAERRTS